MKGFTRKLNYDETIVRVQHYYDFHAEASRKVQIIKSLTSQTQGPDRTLSFTTLNSIKMIHEGLIRIKTKITEINPNFIQHIDVRSLLTLFVENFYEN